MSLFASTRPLYTDPQPYVDVLGTRSAWRDQPAKRLRWHSPRPELCHVQHNRPNPILDSVRRHRNAPADVLWAIEHGATKPYDKRSKRLRSAARIGGAELRPFDGEWEIHRARTPAGKELEACLDHTVAVLTRFVRLTATPTVEEN